MATVCSFCGQELPRGGDARFCTHCGKLVPNQSSGAPNAQTPVARNVPPPANNRTPVSPNLGWHEQLAKQPPARTEQPQIPNATPWLGLPAGNDAGNVTPWLGLPGQDAGNAIPWHGIQGQDPHFIPPALDTQRDGQPAAAPGSEKDDESRKDDEPRKKQRDIPASDNPAGRDQAQPGFYRSTRPSNPGGARRMGASGRLSRQNSDEQPEANVVWPEPITHVMANDEKQKNTPASAQSDFPVSSSPAKPAAQAETQQDQEVEYLPTMPLTSQNPRSSTPVSDEQIEDLPTSIISDPTRGTDAYVEDLPTSIISSASVAAEQSARDQRDQREHAGRRQAEDIDQMPTAQMRTNQKEPRPSATGPSPAAAPSNIDVARPTYRQPPTTQPPITPREAVSYPGNTPSVQETPGIPLAGRHFETQAASFKPLRAPRRKKRSLLVGIIAAIVIVALGFGCWVILAQPFAVSADTNPLQTATSSSLGLTIAYPAGWTATQTSTALTLADSNNTDQMKITQSASSDSDQTGYLKQQAAKSGMTDAQAGTNVSFAGNTWQQIHGDFIVSGAVYSGSIYATTHNNHLYTLIQMAPKITFQDEESLVFAPARTSLHF